jgi:probable HAF family extracellular repeat protein
MGSGFKALLAALGMSASLASHAITSQWTAIDLTPEGPGYASAISAAGVVVGCRNVANTETRAFVYVNGARRDLAAPPGATSCATAVSDSGLVAGRINGEITLWENDTARGLGMKGNVTGIADNGVLVGAMEDGTTSQFGGANTRAFMWSNGVLTDLGAPSGVTTAVGINRRGQVAVIANGKLFMYENGALRDLGVTVTTASGFNDRGEIVGMTSFGHGPEPYIYDGVVRQIPGAYSYASAVGLNNTGQILGSGEGVYGFLMEAGQVARLDTLMGAPWGHSEPKAINDRGWIAGHGGSSSDFHAFLLMPKEAAAPAPAASGNGNPLMRYSPKSRPLLMIRAGTAP